MWVPEVSTSHAAADLLLPSAPSRLLHQLNGVEYRIDVLACVVVAYLAAVYGLKKLVAHRGKPFQLKGPLIAWNLFLAVVSAYLLARMMQTVSVAYHTQAESLWELVCDQHARLEDAAYMEPLRLVFLTKYLELIDTAFLCLRGKPTPFIHVYHHAITIYFMQMHLTNHTCVTWLMVTMNLAVHVLLYSYYGLSAAGMDIFFKRYLTIIQIAQFCLTLVPSLIVFAARIIFTIDPSLPGAYPCNGSWFSASVGSGILLSYLYLFLQLYLARFDADGTDRKRSMKHTAVDGDLSVTRMRQSGAAATHADAKKPTSDGLQVPVPVASPQGRHHTDTEQFISPTHATAQPTAHAHVQHLAARSEMVRRHDVQRRGRGGS